MYHTHLRMDCSHENRDTEWNSGERRSLPASPASVETDWAGAPAFEASAVPELVRRGRRVRVRLAEAIPLIRRAMEEQLAWVDDFDEETIDISTDLLELLAVYRRFGRE